MMLLLPEHLGVDGENTVETLMLPSLAARPLPSCEPVPDSRQPARALVGSLPFWAPQIYCS